MKPNKETKCGVCDPPHFEMNNYYYGKQFTVRDLLQEQSYLNDKRRLINRTVLGWGVVCGLDVCWDAAQRKLVVQTGMALDCCGHEIVVCEEQRVPFGQLEEESGTVSAQPEHEGKFVLCLEYDQCRTEPVELPSPGCGQQGEVEYNRVRDGFKLTVKPWAEACPKQPHGHVHCLDRFKDGGNACHTEPLHQHLCSTLAERRPDCKPCDCVILATIYVRRSRGGQQPPPPEVVYSPPQPAAAANTAYPSAPPPSEKPCPKQGEHEGVEVLIDACTDRRLVYSNALLYDLIYCHHGDLPHVVDFSWREHAYPGREIDWETFVDMLERGFTVYFDQPMDEASLNRHTFFITYLNREEDTGAYLVKRIPFGGIQQGQVKDGRYSGCYSATFDADEVWVKERLRDRGFELSLGVDVEITLRGSRIWSQKDKKALDGEFLADKLPTGNGTQGGDFVDWFRVRKRAGHGGAEPYDDF